MEKWDILDADGNPTGQTMVRGTRMRAGQYHLVVHIWVTDSHGRILLQQRAKSRKLMPGQWAATGGSAIAGENGETAAMRELAEELGIQTQKGEMTHIGTLKRRNAFTDIWLLKRDIDETALHLQVEEVEKVCWVGEQKLRAMIVGGEFHDYGRAYFDLVMPAIRAAK